MSSVLFKSGKLLQQKVCGIKNIFEFTKDIELNTRLNATFRFKKQKSFNYLSVVIYHDEDYIFITQ